MAISALCQKRNSHHIAGERSKMTFGGLKNIEPIYPIATGVW